MKVKSRLPAIEMERALAKAGILPLPADHPIYREQASMVFMPGHLAPGIMSDPTVPPAEATATPDPSAPARDPLAPSVRADFGDDETFEEARGYWNTHVGRVLALRRGCKAPSQATPATPADPGQPS